MADYPNHIRPDVLYKIPIEGGRELTVSPSLDILHHWHWLGAWCLRYWDSDARSLHSVWIAEVEAEKMIHHLDLEVCPRTYITEAELEQFREFGATMLEQTFADEFPPED